MRNTTRSLAWRTLAITIALMLSLGILPGLIAAHSAAAQADATISQSDFEDLVSEATADDPAYGPEEGDLDIDPDKVTFSKADVESADFYAEATFQNPYAGSANQFDYGIQFRSSTDAFLRFIVISDGTWGITQGTDGVLVSGTYEDLDVSRRGENKVSVYADGDTLHVAINDDYVGSTTTDVTDDGSISVGTSFLPDSVVEGETTSFTDFSIWELGGGGGLGPSKKKTPTPTDEEPAGTTYESPTYGFTVAYDDTWEVTKDDTKKDTDDFRISNGTSSIQFLSYEYDGTTEDCITETLANLNDDPDFEDVTVATDNDDNELQGTLDDGSAYVVVTLTYQDSDLITYYQCSSIEEGTSIVKITHITNADDYNDQIDARIAVLDTFSPTGKTTSPKKTATPEEDVTPADETPVADETPSDLPAGSVVVYLEAATADGPVVLGSLIPDGRNSAEVQVFVLGGETGATYTVSFNDGTCKRPGDVVVEVGDTDSSGMLDGTVDTSVEDLSNGDLVMILSDSDSGDVVACGDPSDFVE